MMGHSTMGGAESTKLVSAGNGKLRDSYPKSEGRCLKEMNEKSLVM